MPLLYVSPVSMSTTASIDLGWADATMATIAQPLIRVDIIYGPHESHFNSATK
jgi:hypothetical protein